MDTLLQHRSTMRDSDKIFLGDYDPSYQGSHTDYGGYNTDYSKPRFGGQSNFGQPGSAWVPPSQPQNFGGPPQNMAQGFGMAQMPPQNPSQIHSNPQGYSPMTSHYQTQPNVMSKNSTTPSGMPMFRDNQNQNIAYQTPVPHGHPAPAPGYNPMPMNSMMQQGHAQANHAAYYNQQGGSIPQALPTHPATQSPMPGTTANIQPAAPPTGTTKEMADKMGMDEATYKAFKQKLMMELLNNM